MQDQLTFSTLVEKAAAFIGNEWSEKHEKKKYKINCFLQVVSAYVIW